ncbi:BspA family leucine-rich repeat surface protein [Bifidobacterium sp. ESL0728]|uniref:BspA family leucine-rich repeat surface protein n=1 Tax=Bifidobacterium sp. ESL0728 TaxID=2983220 RepID=UPI0023F95161|nr:BspA family leucine-rich repeat surface protein [Bifidobacterium sp. ESL0728]WEV58707.1 BspA family leucine-rich repeat surface protein [Bifidobacterium sp. ESL0728]
MRSFNKATIGLIVATAMLAGTVVTGASANEIIGAQIQPDSEATTSVQESTSAAGETAKDDGQKDASASGTAQGSASGKSQSSSAESSAGSQSEAKSGQPSAQSQEPASTPTPQTGRQPQAQGGMDSSIKFQADWGPDGDSSDAHWYIQEVGTNQYVMHIGPGVLAGEHNSPNEKFAYDSVAESLKKNIVRIVFDDAPNTHVVPSTHFYFNGYQRLEQIDNVGDVDFSGLQGPAQEGHEHFDFLGSFASNPVLKSLDLTGWGTSRSAAGAGLPGSKASSKWKTKMTLSMGTMFAYDPDLTTITGLDDWDTSAVTSMSFMLRILDGRSQLRSVGDLSRWDMSNVTDTQYMFQGNGSLEGLGDLSGWDLGKDECTEYMFDGASSIGTLGNVSHWEMGNVTDMQGMFMDMHSLSALPGIGSWDVSKNMWFNSMFQNDSVLTKLDLTDWNTDSATEMSYMFYNSFALTQIKGIENFKTGKVAHMSGMFGGGFSRVGSVTTLDVSGWDTSNVVDMSNMFRSQQNLTEIKGLQDWNVSKLVDMSDMFWGDYNLTTIDLSGWGTGAVTVGPDAFPYGLKSLKLGPQTKIKDTFFYSEPSGSGAVESDGYTGRWAQADEGGDWASDATQGDNESLSALTQTSDFKGGTFVWQEFAEVSFRKNAPKGVKVTGKPVTIRKVGADASNLRIKVPRLMFHAKNYKFFGWNSGKNGGQVLYRKGDTITNFKRGEKIRLWAQWQSKSVPMTPVTVKYTVHYEADAPEGLTAGGATPDDVFTVVPAEGLDLMRYPRTVAANGFSVDGYKFVGWSTESAESGEPRSRFLPGHEILVAPGTTTLYAVWETAPVDTGTTLGPVKPAGPTKPTTPATPAEPTIPAGPATPPASSVTPIPPVTPHLPAPPAPVAPPTKPTNPPATPANQPKPVTPVNPSKPKPATPANRPKPTTPANPNKPKPATPANRPKPTTPPTTPANQPKPTPATPASPAAPTSSPTSTAPSEPAGPVAPVSPSTSGVIQRAQAGNAVVPQAAVTPVAALPAPAPALAAAPAPAFAPAPGAAGNAPAPVTGNDGVAPVPQQQRPRPTCIPEDVYGRMKSGKGTHPVYWIEPDGTAYVQKAWSLSDYNGLPRCSIEATAPASGVRVGFNFLWLLIFLIPLFLLFLAYRNGGYIVARHRDLDSAEISK